MEAGEEGFTVVSVVVAVSPVVFAAASVSLVASAGVCVAIGVAGVVVLFSAGAPPAAVTEAGRSEAAKEKSTGKGGVQVWSLHA